MRTLLNYLNTDMKVNPNENVYPVVLQHGLTHDSHVEVGLTKRELFAAMAMQGILANDQAAYDPTVWAVRYADGLIVELNKEVQQ